MRFERKIFLLFAAVIVVWMIAVNAIIFTFFSYEEIQRLDGESRFYLYLKQHKPDFRAPEFLIITREPVSMPGFKLFKKSGGYYVYFKRSYMYGRLKRFFAAIVAWEISLAAILMLMIHAVLKHFLNKEKSHREFLGFLLGAISHKMGNFLAVQKINLELIESENEKPVQRLREAYEFMEKDFKSILNMIRNAEVEDIKKINVREAIEGVLNTLSERIGSRKLDVDVEEFTVRSRDNDFVNLVHEVLENALKYSESYIRIRTFRKGRLSGMVVENDIKHAPGGSGFGMELIKYLAKRNGWHISVKTDENRHEVTLMMES